MSEWQKAWPRAPDPKSRKDKLDIRNWKGWPKHQTPGPTGACLADVQRAALLCVNHQASTERSLSALKFFHKANAIIVFPAPGDNTDFFFLFKGFIDNLDNKEKYAKFPVAINLYVIEFASDCR